MKSKAHRLFVVAFAPILFLATPAAFATVGTWNYDGSTAASNSWATAGSWSGGLPNAVGDTANFTFNLASANRTITTDGIKTVGTLNIGDPTSTYYNYTLSTGTAGSYLILDQTGVANTAINFSTAASTAANTVSVPIVLNDNVVITSSVTASANPTQTFSGIISDGSGTAYSVTKSGAGLITFSAANTYRGGTTISAGRITGSNVASFGTSDVTVASGGQALISGTTAAYPNNFNITGTGCPLGTNEANSTNLLGALRYANSSTSGTITVNSAGARIGAATGTTGILNGSLAGNGALEINSTTATHIGTFTLNGSASGYSGTMTVSQGTLKLGSASALGGNLTIVDAAKFYSNNIAVDGTAPTMAGTLTLGSTTGTSLYLDPSTSNVLSVGGNLALVGTNIVYLSTVYPGTSVPVLKYSGSVTAGTVAANLGLAGGTATYRAGTGFSTTGSGPYTINLTLNPGNVTWTPSVTTGNWDTTATNWTEGVTTGKVYFNGDNVTFAEPTAAATVTIASGVTVAPTSVAVTNTSNSITLTGTGLIAGAPAISKSGAGTVSVTPAIAGMSGGTFTMSGGTLTSTSSTALALTLNASLSGTLTLGSSNSANYGAINFTGSSHTIADNTSITLPASGAFGASCSLTGPTQLGAHLTTSNAVGTSGNGTITIGGTSTLTANTTITTSTAYVSGNITTLNGNVTDGASTYSLTKEGPGALKLVTANTYKGGTIVNNGLLYAQNAASLGTGDVTIAGNMTTGAQLLLSSAGTVTNAFKISGAGIPLSGLGDTSGDGAIQLNTSNQTLTGPITLTGNARITGYFSSSNEILSGVISGDGNGTWSLDFGSPGAGNGCGTITLSGNNSYTGGTNIYRTILRGWSNSAFGTGGVTIGGDASATLTTRLEVGTNITLPNNFNLSSVGKTDSTVNYGEITCYPGDTTTLSTAVVNGTVNITATPANGGHFATQGNAANVLRVMGAITSSVPVIVAAGIVELGGGGTNYNFLTQAKDTLHVAATNGIATSAIVTQGTTGAAVLDLNGFSQTLVGLVKSTNAASVTNNGGSPATLTLAPTDGATHSYAGTFAGGSSALNLAIGGSNASVTSLTASSTSFSGTTTVGNGGILNLPSGVTLGNASSAATCGNGGKLTGLGTFGGSLSLTNGASVDVDPALGHLNVTGNLTVTGTVTINLLSAPGPSITVIGCSGTLSATAGNFVLANAGTYNSPHFAVVGNTLVLTTGALSLTWTGSGSSTWMVGGTSNWTDGTNARAFLNGDSTAFTDAPSSNQTVYVSGTVQPTSVTFNNTTRSYTLVDLGSASLLVSCNLQYFAL